MLVVGQKQAGGEHRLTTLLSGIDYTNVGDIDAVTVDGVYYDSRNAQPGCLFICLPGARFDGHDFAHRAVAAGAKALVCQRPLALSCPQVVVKDCREALARIAVNYYRQPFQDLTLMAVTGTNGKTTIAHMLQAITGQAGLSGLIGTLGIRIGHGEYVATGNTTPESLELQRQLRSMANSGAAYVAVEASSQGIAKHRLDHTLVDAAVFTNLTWDHMDYHKTLDQYFACKARLFQQIKPGGIAVINIDDNYGKKMAALAQGRVITYSMLGKADCTAAIVQRRPTETKLRFQLGADSFEAAAPVLLDYNAANALAAAATAWGLGIKPALIRRGLEQLEQVPGRMEKVDFGQDYGVFIDFAHTPDALEKLLKGIKAITPKRLIVIFGSVGNGDRGKRPQMAAIAEKYGDVVIVTSTQPKYEKPEEIIAEICKGFTGDNYTQIVERGQAVEHALSLARAGDTVVLAGFGHQKHKLIQGQAIPYSDYQAAARYFMKLAQKETAGADAD